MTDVPRTQEHTLQIAGSDKTYSCAPNDTVMRAALRAGIGFAYECNVGSCGSCRFELISGEVDMAWPQAPAWTDRDRERNRYLGCQARARSDCVVKPRVKDQYVPPHKPVRTHGILATRREITHDITEFRFEMAQPVLFNPGQYVLVYLPGVDGARAYSMSNLPGDGGVLELQVKRTPTGRGTAVLFEMLIGTEVAIDGPYGMAWLRTDVERDILCLAGGSGLAPMISIARAVVTEPRLRNVNLHFVYGGRTARDICGEDILRGLSGWGERIHYHPVVSSIPEQGEPEWTGAFGFVHEIAHQRFAQHLAQMEIYFAGPPAMATAVQRMLTQEKVPFSQIHFDQFY